MPSYYQDADIPGMLQDFGVPVDFDGLSAVQCLVDYVDEVVLKENGIGGTINKAVTVSLQTSTFPTLAAGDPVIGEPITVDGTPYKVRLPLQQSDGAMTHLLCTN